jgi:small subunit ribosomal protein S16
MATIIKMQRQGAPHKPFWRVIVTDSRHPNGTIEQLGTYDNKHKPVRVELDAKKVERWLTLGALPTPTVRQLFRREGLMPAAAKTVAK